MEKMAILTVYSSSATVILSSVESVELLLRSITVEKEEDPTVYHIC